MDVGWRQLGGSRPAAAVTEGRLSGCKAQQSSDVCAARGPWCAQPRGDEGLALGLGAPAGEVVAGGVSCPGRDAICLGVPVVGVVAVGGRCLGWGAGAGRVLAEGRGPLGTWLDTGAGAVF